jgi:hypothetical protein
MAQPDDRRLDLPIVDPSPFFGAATPPDSPRPNLPLGLADDDMSAFIDWGIFNDATGFDPEVAALASGAGNSVTPDFLNMFPANTNSRAAQTVNLAANMPTLFSPCFRSTKLMLT